MYEDSLSWKLLGVYSIVMEYTPSNLTKLENPPLIAVVSLSYNRPPGLAVTQSLQVQVTKCRLKNGRGGGVKEGDT